MSRDSKDAAKSKKILDDCLKQPDNKICCECGTKQPRWASTNLGCFMCIRCSGMHRNLGVHISKVKSVSLDTWPIDQAEFMATMGNEKHNAIWEYAMPANRKPHEDDTNYVVEQFIKDKYEKKMFCKPEKVAKKGKKGAKAAAEAAPAKKTATKAKKKKESSSEESSSESSSESESESSEDERAKKKKAAAAKKKAVPVKAKPKSESEESSEDDSEDERAKAKKAKAAAKNKKAEKTTKKSKSPAAVDDSFNASFAATSIAPATNGHAAAPAADFGSFDTDFGSAPSGFDAPASSGGAGDFFSSEAAQDPFNTAPVKKTPSAAATKSIMDKFGAANNMMNPMMGMAGGMGGMGGFGAQGMPAQAMPNMYANPQQYGANPYMMQQQQQYNPYAQQQQQQPQGFGQQGGYNPYGQAAAPPAYTPAGQMGGYGQPALQQQGYGGYPQMQQQQANPFGAFPQQSSGGGPLDNIGQQQAAPAAAAPQPAKADPFGEFGGMTGFGAPSKPAQQPAAAANAGGGFFF